MGISVLKCCKKKAKDKGSGEFKPLANPKLFRSLSDKLDVFIGWDEETSKNKSRIRGILHGIWHTGAYLVTCNKLEWERAKIQFQGKRTSA